jgi:hypothetical protein
MAFRQRSADSHAAGVFGRNFELARIYGYSGAGGPAIFGENTGTGLAGRFIGPVIVQGQLYAVIALTNGTAIYGKAPDDSAGVGVQRDALGKQRGRTASTDSAAVWGRALGTARRFMAKTPPAASRTVHWSCGRRGQLIVQGVVSKSGGSFRIDHPLDPANKFLSHSFVESPDMKNIYDGNVTTDASGSATVTLPDYFAALNRDYRYQLTVLGQFAQAIVSRKIAGNSFEIRTDKPGVEVSWQVTGIRQDAFAQANPIVVEESKPAEEQGLYLFPAGFGASEEKQIGHSRPATPHSCQKKTK